MEYGDSSTLPEWLERLGYDTEAESLLRDRNDVPRNHPYAREISSLLSPDGLIQAQAVFAADGTPSVVFVDRTGSQVTQPQIDLIRQRIWNQNLASVVVEIRGREATAFPAGKVAGADAVTLSLDEARADGPFSARDVKSADLAARQPEWFKRTDRVDHRLIGNIGSLISEITENGLVTVAAEDARLQIAQLLVGQVLFISYLEHRAIVGDNYRARRSVGSLHDLVKETDRDGLGALINALKGDFNGDFLGDDSQDHWDKLNDVGFTVINDFLRQTDIRTGQEHFWKYDFSFIPVELLSSLYESFLTSRQRKSDGAVYTPRHLAVLAVDQAFSVLSSPTTARIFDGACGSGILLTTSLRRLISEHESLLNRVTTFTERRDIVKKQIFGADINAVAGRVTAFSLYLSILEDLTPADILADQEKFNSKLPSLAGENLVCGAAGNFFSPSHPFLNAGFDLILSNPPWVEIAGGEVSAVDTWAAATNQSVVRRQIAAAYSLRAQEFLRPEAALCLILPIGLFLGATSTDFVRRLFRATKPLHLINFGDLQQLLFPTAINTCHVYVGLLREKLCSASLWEEFDYSVPKADLSLAMGRLSLQSSDRHKLLTAEVTADNDVLTHFMWGDRQDLALISRLRSFGRLGDMTQAPNDRWTIRKGVHVHDASREPQSAERLSDFPFYSTTNLNHNCPIEAAPTPALWPQAFAQVVGLDDKLMSVFEGPRVLFADGFAKDDTSPRAVFLSGKGAFTSSVGVIAGPARDEMLLRFLAVYLRSSMAQFLMIMTNAKMLTERNALHLTEVKDFPFFRPEFAPDSEKADAALKMIDRLLRELERVSTKERSSKYAQQRRVFDEEIFNYFDLSEDERANILEVVEVLQPFIRPRSIERLEQASRAKAKAEDIEVYRGALLQALKDWRDASKGTGNFLVSAMVTENAQAGSLAIATVERMKTTEETGQHAETLRASTRLIDVTVKALHETIIEPSHLRRGLGFMPTVEVWLDDKFHVVRPLQRRNWTRRMAMRDAERLVENVRRLASGPSVKGNSQAI